VYSTKSQHDSDPHRGNSATHIVRAVINVVLLSLDSRMLQSRLGPVNE
jgi:hypothetical protein